MSEQSCHPKVKNYKNKIFRLISSVLLTKIKNKKSNLNVVVSSGDER